MRRDLLSNVAREYLRADPDRQSAGADRSAAGTCRARRERDIAPGSGSTNVALAELAERLSRCPCVDIAAALAAAGSERLLDDGLVGFTHFGSPGWMLQRPESEKAAVHGIFPDMAPLVAALGGDPYGREAVIAANAYRRAGRR